MPNAAKSRHRGSDPLFVLRRRATFRVLEQDACSLGSFECIPRSVTDGVQQLRPNARELGSLGGRIP